MVRGWRIGGAVLAAIAATALFSPIALAATSDSGGSSAGTSHGRAPSGSTRRAGKPVHLLPNGRASDSPTAATTVPEPTANPAPSPAAPTATPAAAGTRLTITIAKSTTPGHNATFTLMCHPTGGTHPDPTNGCAKLDKFGASGTDPFAPVPSNQACSMVYGGPATAQITGSWQGRSINATFNRSNGCQTTRWNNMLPILSPESASQG